MPSEKKFAPAFHVFISEDLTKEACIHWTDSLGKRHRRKGGINRFHTYESWLDAANALVAKLQEEYVPPSTIANQMLAWIEERRGGWRLKSYQTFKSKVDVFLEWAKGREVTQSLVQEFFKCLLAERHNKTYNAYLATLLRIFKAIGLAHFMEGLKSVSANSTPAKYFQKHQIERIKKHLLESNPNLWLAFQFIYYCFIRLGELRLLQIGDNFFDEYKICVRAEISKNKKQQFVTVPVAFRPCLDALKHRSPKEFVFYHEDCTKPLSKDCLNRNFRKALTALGFGQEYQLYGAKHSGAVALGREKVNIEQIRKQLRHHSLDETQIYTQQLGVEDLDDLAASFPEI
ncbi:MAG: site-specific integrase [Saprospiraceae bacterium]|nr:site-specific integrase [Saprospiraceae bacterium]